jgi:putative membrane protein insertion efficiency factor
MRHIFAGIITFYQRVISPYLPRSCRFYPTCSDYSRQAILKYGVIKGGAMAMKRLLKCHPWHPGGYDPVK